MRRVIDIIKWDLTTHRRAYTLQLFVGYGLSLLFMLYPYLTGKIGREDDWDYTIYNADVIVILGVITFICYLTQLSAPFNGKQNRISMLMLPASMHQKLLARLVFVGVIVPAGILTASIAADLTQLVIGAVYSLMKGSAIHSYIPRMADTLTDILSAFLPRDIESVEDFFKYLFELQALLCIVAYPLACGALWPRHALLLCVITGTGLPMIFGTITVFLGYFSFLMGFTALGTLFNCFMLWLGYRAFINREVADKMVFRMTIKKKQ